MAIFKAASRSIREAMMRLPGAVVTDRHSTRIVGDWLQMQQDGYVIFSFVRDPLERFISGFNEINLRCYGKRNAVNVRLSSAASTLFWTELAREPLLFSITLEESWKILFYG